MAKKKKPKIGALGPQPHWLRMSIAEREKTKRYIKEGLAGYVRSDGISIPAARRIYSGLNAADGYDLRHVERWSAAKLDHARKRIQALNTLTSRPFSVIIPRSQAQRKAAQSYTGQKQKYQKEYIAQVQIQDRDKAVFRRGKVAIERKFKGGSKTIKQRFLFADYLRPDETVKEALLEEEELSEEEIEEAYEEGILEQPTTFRAMIEITKRMMLDMPKNIYGQPAFYALFTKQYGPIGRTAVHSKILDLLADYFNRYDPGGSGYRGHEQFAEQIIGFQMIGTWVQLTDYDREKAQLKAMRKKRNKLKF